MPVKKDDTGRRWIEMELITPGTPEQVWRAMATGAGISAWFTSTTVGEGVGGEVRFDFGPEAIQLGEVTAWEPPHRFAYVERDWDEGASPLATEITITARSGDRCLVRMVHSLFSSSDDWDDQLESFEGGWPTFFEVLKLYLAHFAGQPAASFTALSTVEGDSLAVWRRLTRELELAGAEVGERRATPPRPERLSGVVEVTRQGPRERYVMLRLEEPAPGVALVATYGVGPRVNASVSLYYYGRDADARARASGERWRAWLEGKPLAAEPV